MNLEHGPPHVTWLEAPMVSTAHVIHARFLIRCDSDDLVKINPYWIILK